MVFIAATLNHLRAVHSWASNHDAHAQVDIRNFELEVRARNRYFRFMPRFLATVNGRMSHLDSFTPEAMGMIGWLPYRTPLQWDLASDKLAFKRLLASRGHATPDHWLDPARASSDFILKRSRGSFGYGLEGPFRKGAPVSLRQSTESNDEHFAEAFVSGRNVKVWFWGAQPFFAHIHAYPEVEGDDVTRLHDLIEAKLGKVGLPFDESAEMQVVRQSLAYQGVAPDEVLESGRKVWLDYRYGRRFLPAPPSHVNDNDWPGLHPAARDQCEALGDLLATELFRIFPAPVLYSVDGVIDAHERISWLEMNSNPILPPDGYPLILETLFGRGVRSS